MTKVSSIKKCNKPISIDDIVLYCSKDDKNKVFKVMQDMLYNPEVQFSTLKAFADEMEKVDAILGHIYCTIEYKNEVVYNVRPFNPNISNTLDGDMRTAKFSKIIPVISNDALIAEAKSGLTNNVIAHMTYVDDVQFSTKPNTIILVSSMELPVNITELLQRSCK